MRKLLSFIAASALLGGGLWVIVVEALWSRTIWARSVVAAATLIAFGGYWLWVDFIAPALGIRIKE